MELCFEVTVVKVDLRLMSTLGFVARFYKNCTLAPECRDSIPGGAKGASAPLNIWNNKKAFFTNAQSRFAAMVLEGVMGPPRLSRPLIVCL